MRLVRGGFFSWRWEKFGTKMDTSIREIKSVSRRSIEDAKSAFQGERGEEQHGVAFDGRGGLEDLDCGLGKAANCIVVCGSREKCEVESATGAGYEGVREAGAFGDCVQG